MAKRQLTPNDQMGHLLEHRLRHAAVPAGEVCADAETLASYVDDGMSGTERAEWEAHFATCAKCRRSLALMARLKETASPAFEGEGSRGPTSTGGNLWVWMPLAACVLVGVGLWFATRPADRTSLASSSIRPATQVANGDDAGRAPAAALVAPAAPARPAEAAGQAGDGRLKDTERRESAGRARAVAGGVSGGAMAAGERTATAEEKSRVDASDTNGLAGGGKAAAPKPVPVDQLDANLRQQHSADKQAPSGTATLGARASGPSAQQQGAQQEGLQQRGAQQHAEQQKAAADRQAASAAGAGAGVAGYSTRATAGSSAASPVVAAAVPKTDATAAPQSAAAQTPATQDAPTQAAATRPAPAAQPAPAAAAAPAAASAAGAIGSVSESVTITKAPAKAAKRATLKEGDAISPAERAAGLLAVVSDPASSARRWRVFNVGRIEVTRDAGATWTNEVQAADVAFAAVSAPAPGVCWVVGTKGSVWRLGSDEGSDDASRDGSFRAFDRRASDWQQRNAPTSEGLVSVTATSARDAVVVTRSGQRFVTGDGGTTWTRQ